MTTDPAPIPLTAPADGVPEPLTTAAEFASAATSLRAGTGPIALDTERASGFRYADNAWLIQIRRAGAGTFLIDPSEDAAGLTPLLDALDGPEWILHAALNDLPSLRALGFRCHELFDTEAAGRLLGAERVNLAAMVEAELGFTLAKGHGAADWSKRPLPAAWLNYAALDVECLIELRAALVTTLQETGRTSWAAEEFAYILQRPEPAPRIDPWRRTSGINAITDRRALARVRELWLARDTRARTRDLAPGKVLPDAALVAAALANPATPEALHELPGFGGRRQRHPGYTDIWLRALARARELPDRQLPPRSGPSPAGPPPARRWARVNPEAAQRLSQAREAITTISDDLGVATETLLDPAALRAVCWDPLPDPDAAPELLRAAGARAWQVEVCGAAVAAALAAPPPATDPA